MKSRMRWRLSERLRRIEVHLDDPKVRGTSMNMSWIHWSSLHYETWCHLDDAGLGVSGPLVKM